MKLRKRLKPEHAKKLGFEVKRNDKGRNTARYFITTKQLVELQNINQQLKILVFDIETSPIKAYTWRLWKQTISHDNIISDWIMLTWSAKWLFSDNVLSDKLTVDESKKENDYRICQSIWDLLNEADIVIAHNGDKFDLRKLNTRFMYHGMGTPSSYQSIDTLKHARKQMAVSSNRLDYLGQFFGLGKKLEHSGFDLWVRCMNHEEEAFNEMERYNIQDVLLLESVYLHLRPFIKPHPNVGLLIGDNIHRCPSCGSDKLEPRSDYYTTVNVFTEFYCNDCGSNCRSRKANKSKSGVMSSLPK